MPVDRLRVRSGAAATLGILLSLAVFWDGQDRVAADPKPEAASTETVPRAGLVRRPVALVLTDGDRQLLCANRQSGSISVIDLNRNAVVGELGVAEALSDLVAVPGGQFLVATDPIRNMLLLLKRKGSDINIVDELVVPAEPVTVRVSDDGRRCFVCSLWARRLTVVEIQVDQQVSSGSALKVAAELPLRFAPRQQVWLTASRRLVVADAFGGNVAVIDPEQGKIESLRSFPAHNIAGLRVSNDGESLLVSHQILNPRGRTDANDVHWGVLMTNLLRIIPLSTVLDGSVPLLRDSATILMGDVGRAGGDPSGIAEGPGGRYVVAMSGVGEVSVSQPNQEIQNRLPAGTRPTAIIAAGDGTRVFVADTFGDAIHVLDVVESKTDAVISLGRAPELTAVDRGELLFYNARLSQDGWMSCHSCHTDGHTNGLLADNLGDGSFDAPKRVPPLGGVADTGPWGWNGSFADLRTQIRTSVTSTMRGKPISDAQAADLEAYLQTLQVPKHHSVEKPDDTRLQRGRAVFEAQGCQQCHVPPAYTSAKTYDVGLEDELGNRKFNPPSLRGVGQRDRLFHDNRASSLEAVLTTFKHQLDDDLSPEELADLLAFLRRM